MPVKRHSGQLRSQLAAALGLIGGVLLALHCINRYQAAAMMDRIRIDAAFETAMSTMAEQLVHLGKIEAATSSAFAHEDRLALGRSIPEIATAIEVLQRGIDAQTMAPGVRALFIDPFSNPLPTLRRVLRNSGTVARTPGLWGQRAEFHVAIAEDATMEAIEVIRRIRAAEKKDANRAAIRQELWHYAALGVVTTLLVLIWGTIFRPLHILIAENEEKLRAGRRAAEEASAVKSTFIATISHEIRTPLVGILGSAELLKDTPHDDERAVLADTIIESGEALLAILDDTLSYSKIEAGRIVLETAPTDIPALLDGLHRMFEARARQKGISFEVSIASGLAPAHVADGLRLRQIVSNLIGNAVKFTERGGIRVSVTGQRSGPKTQTVTIDVSDTGIGMAPGELDVVFEAFRQADGTTERNYGVTGLGLAIARSIASAMGGTLVARSTPGSGSSFVLELDLPVADADAVMRTGPRGSPDAGPSSRIAAPERAAFEVEVGEEDQCPVVLVVDDNRTNRMIAHKMLAGRGRRIEMACDGVEALSAYERLRPALIFMDISMPRMDGYATTRAIREMERANAGDPARIIGLSAHASQTHRAQCLASGMDDLMTKPLRRADLLELVMRAPPKAEASQTRRASTG